MRNAGTKWKLQIDNCRLTIANCPTSPRASNNLQLSIVNCQFAIPLRNPHSGGFATVMAVSLIALIAMALTAMMWRIKDDTFAVRADRRSAELRQLLIAGAAAAPRLLGDASEEWQIPLPPHLADRSGAVTLRRLPAERDFERLVRVEARLDGVTKWQTLRYARGQQGWGLMGADLGGGDGDG